MTIAVILTAVITGILCLLGLVAFIEEKANKTAVRDARDQVAGELVAERYMNAWDSLQGLPIRLRLLAGASEQLAQECRRAALADRPPPRLTFDDDALYAPLELEDSAARPGQHEYWQPLDRALHRLSAIYDDENAAVHADAHEHVSLAADELAAHLDQSALPIDLDHCWLCERAAPDVPRLLSTPHAAICEACVQACHDMFADR